LHFEEFEVATVDFDEELRTRFVFEGVSERFVLARRTHDDTPVVLFHHAGKLDFGGKRADVWEALLSESPFAQALFARMGKSDVA